MNSDRIARLLDAMSFFNTKRVLVIGDIIVDHFIYGSVSRISPEAPVPIVEVKKDQLLLGGGANVLHNIYSLGGRASICGLIGNDAMGDHLEGLLRETGADTMGLVRCDRPTTVKTRVIAQGQQVVRFDREKAAVPAIKSIDAMLAYLDAKLGTFDVIVVSDYFKGAISGAFMARLQERLSLFSHIPVIVDPKPFAPDRFKNVFLITPNHHEAERMSGIAIHDDVSCKAAATRLKEMLQCRAVLITRGETGMSLLEEDGTLCSISTAAREVFDVTGAGDTVAATLALGMASGLDVADAAHLANCAAGIVVGKVGTATVTFEELQEMVDGYGGKA